MASWMEKAGIALRAAQVGSIVLAERIRPPQVRTVDDVPGSVAQITPEWLTAVLCAQAPGARVLGLSITGGDAGSSTRLGLALDLNDAARDAGIPQRVFTKSAPGFVQRMFLGLSDAAVGEAGFYMQVRPQLDIEAPRGYHACVDQRSWRCITLMEDLVATRNARFISTETYISRDMMADLLGNMARWHAQFWNDPRLDRELAWIRPPSRFLADMNRFVSIKDRALLAVEKYPQLVPERLHAAGDAVWTATVASYELDRRLPQTFLHGDAHVGQTYICGDGRMGYSDWQLVQRGGWATDFAYGLCSALTIEDRRRWERELLRHYLDALQAAGGPALDEDSAWMAYRQHTLYPFIAWAFTRAGASTVLPDMQRDSVCNDIMSRTAHAVDDLDAIRAVSAMV